MKCHCEVIDRSNPTKSLRGVRPVILADDVAISSFRRSEGLPRSLSFARNDGRCCYLRVSAEIPLLDYHLSSVGICGKINFPEITDSNSASHFMFWSGERRI